MTEFELQLEVASLTDEQEDPVLDDFDATVGGHEDTTLVTVHATGPTCEDAFHRVVTDLGAHGITIERAVEDLVSPGAIASRTGVITQSVDLWICDERRSKDPFPRPYSLASNGLWLWAEIDGRLAHNGQRYDDIRFPSCADHGRCNQRPLDQCPTCPRRVTTGPAPASDPGAAPELSSTNHQETPTSDHP